MTWGEGRGWVPASARTTEVGPGSAQGQRSGEEMGPRIREDNGGEGGWVPAPVFIGSLALRGGNEVGRRWVPASARTTEGREDGFPPPGNFGGGARLCAGATEVGRRWAPASARTTEGREDGFPHPRGTTEVGPGSARGQRSGEEMGPRIREDNGGEGGWVPASAGTTEVERGVSPGGIWNWT